ncbi:MAG TPA: hypothetical protein VHV30_17890 [Polyangiaceae bacterium]|jgi:hypothetical protein|nr:hypothetical protein [Polyangiaceae bacterium]
MSSQPDEKPIANVERDGGDNKPDKSASPAFDVVLVHGATGDGEGARVLRARPGQLEVGEIRPLRQGQPLNGGGEVVRLVERPESPRFYDVKVDYEVPGAQASNKPGAAVGHGPAQVATRAYRDSWERIFAPSPAAKKLN